MLETHSKCQNSLNNNRPWKRITVDLYGLLPFTHSLLDSRVLLISESENRLVVIGQIYNHGDEEHIWLFGIIQGDAHHECIFSLVRKKNCTEFRPSLFTSTLSDFLRHKVLSQAMGKHCHQMIFSYSLFDKSRKTAMTYNAQWLSVLNSWSSSQNFDTYSKYTQWLSMMTLWTSSRNQLWYMFNTCARTQYDF